MGTEHGGEEEVLDAEWSSRLSWEKSVSVADGRALAILPGKEDARSDKIRKNH
jgi:hypothetical protein